MRKHVLKPWEVCTSKAKTPLTVHNAHLDMLAVKKHVLMQVAKKRFVVRGGLCGVDQVQMSISYIEKCQESKQTD